MTLGQTWFLTLIQPGSQEAARSLVDSATERGGLDHAIARTWDDLARIEAIVAHPFVLADGLRDLELWKPALIRAQLDLTAPGDSLLYHDAGTGYWGDHRLEVPIAPLLNWAACNNNGMLPGVWVPELGPNRRWASQVCFRTMGCNSQTFWDSPQLQTTYSLWRNDSASIEVLDAWWTACLSVYSQDGADAQELGEFVADRGSQSVLTNLALARGLRTFGEPHERTSVVNHPAIASVPATDIENLINRIRDETEPAPASPADAGSISAGPPARCALFTSIPPEAKRHTTNGIPIGRAYQERCIASWLACGFEVFSVHYRDENALDEPIDGIIRIEVDREEDDPPEEFKPSIRAMLRAVEQVGADVSGLINADIVLVDAPPWIDVVSPQVSGSAVLFSRLDTRDIDRQILGGPPWGFDLILFDRKYIPSLSYCGMRIGECWWDYWFPLAMHFAGAEVKHVTDFLCLHQEHPLVSNAKYDEYGRKIFTWIGALGAGEKV